MTRLTRSRLRRKPSKSTKLIDNPGQKWPGFFYARGKAGGNAAYACMNIMRLMEMLNIIVYSVM